MTSTTIQMNIIEEITMILRQTFTKSLKTKYAEKAIDILVSQDIQKQLIDSITKKIPALKPKAASKARKKKKKKDPSAPKRARSGYIFFCMDKRAEVKKANPEAKVTEISKLLGQLWRETDEKGRAKYVKQNEADKERYAKEMEEYSSSGKEEEWNSNSEESSEKKTSKKAKKTKSKRPKNSYQILCQETRPKIKEDSPDLSPREIMKELGSRWKKVKESDEEVKHWTDLAAKAKKEFEELSASENSASDGDEEEEKEKPKKKPKKKKAKKAASNTEQEGEVLIDRARLDEPAENLSHGELKQSGWYKEDSKSESESEAVSSGTRSNNKFAKFYAKQYKIIKAKDPKLSIPEIVSLVNKKWAKKSAKKAKKQK